MYILRYVDEPKIRQAVEKELNKREHTQRFAKAVFHDNNHEFRQETREEQLIAEGCKRLIDSVELFVSLRKSGQCRREGTGRAPFADPALFHGLLGAH
jgi:alpha-acetolactate decarboxylase